MNDFEPTFWRRRHLSRRALINLSVGLAVVATATSWGLLRPALAQKRAAAGRAEIPLEELMQAGPLPELVLGKEDAPVTLVEYASMTCGHCAAFHNKVFPVLKEKYIDTGNVGRFQQRQAGGIDGGLDAGTLRRRRQDVTVDLGLVCQAR